MSQLLLQLGRVSVDLVRRHNRGMVQILDVLVDVEVRDSALMPGLAFAAGRIVSKSSRGGRFLVPRRAVAFLAACVLRWLRVIGHAH